MSEVAKKTAKPASHPPASVMVTAAVKALKERNGSSTPAIKKYIAANYKADVVKMAPFIKKAIKSLVEKKVLIQTKGSGASGSFKLNAAAAKVEKPKKKPASPKKKTSPKKKVVKSTKSSPAKKVKKSPKKKSAVKKTTTAKKTVTKSPKKAVAKKPVVKKSPKPAKKSTASKKK